MRQRSETLIQQITKTVHLNYLVYLPKESEQNTLKKFPLIIFLHGMGERGNDLDRIKQHGIPRVVEDQEDFPFITVSPQCPDNFTWIDQIDALDTLLVKVLTRYPVDLERVYLTGISMGGTGVWYWAALYTARFAAIAPVCGAGIPAYGFPERVCALKNVPVWAFHGAKDDIVPLAESQIMVETLKECGGNVKLTIYPDAGHDSWTDTYNNPELYDWFMAQKRPSVIQQETAAPEQSS